LSRGQKILMVWRTWFRLALGAGAPNYATLL
jgi:hypothetical protein